MTRYLTSSEGRDTIHRLSRWADVFKISLIAVFIGGLLTLCSFLSFSTHAAIQTSPFQSCAADCGSHGTAQSADAKQQFNEDDDDKEPTPPSYWQFTQSNTDKTLLAGLLSPILLAIIAYLFRKRLLSTQLRF